MITINMRSSANSVKSQGVGSCYDEQVRLVKERLSHKYKVTENAKGEFDIVHFHTVNLNYYFEKKINEKKFVSVGYVHFLPDTLDDSLKLPVSWVSKKAFYKYVLAFYESMDYLVTVNPAIVQKIKDYGIKNPKVYCIPNYVSDKNFFPKNESEKLNIREKYNIPADKFVVLGAGQLQRRKGVQDFIETAKMTPQAHFVWAGGFSFGKITDGYEQLKKITENPPSNVTFLGIIEREDMVDVYNMSDVFFLPSFDELFPMAILEALCCKLPVLLRDIDVYKGILKNCYIKGENPADFNDRINKLIISKDEREFWCEKSWECHERYSAEEISKQWDSFYTTAYNRL